MTYRTNLELVREAIGALDPVCPYFPGDAERLGKITEVLLELQSREQQFQDQLRAYQPADTSPR